MSDSKLWRGAIVSASITAVILIIIIGFINGKSGLVGAVLASFTVLIFFSIHLLVARISRDLDPMITMALAMFSYFAWATSEPNLYRLMFGGYCEIIMEEHDSKAWNLLREALDELMARGVIDKSARNGGEVIVWSAVHGASSLAIEGLMSPSDFPKVLKSIQRSLGMK